VFIFLPVFLGHAATTEQSMLALGASFVLASASYQWVEQPFRRNQDLVLHPRRGLLLGAGLIGASVLCAICVMIVAVVPAATGRPARQTPSVTRNVELATRLQLLPANLSPPLAAVPDDSPFTCLADSMMDSIVTCTLGDVKATRTVAVFGDSHAWQWIRPLADIAARRGWKLVTYTKGACPIDVDNFVTISNFYNFPTYTANFGSFCHQWRNAVFARLATLRPALVIMSSLTYPFVTPGALAETIARVRADGSKVVWLEDTPLPGGTAVPACLSEHPTDIQLCSFSRDDGLDDPGLREALLQSAARAGAEVVDTVPWLCTTTMCPPVIAGTVAYLDNSHISNAYALKLTDQLAAALAPSMPDNKASP
jgi:hypothetical protein